MLGQCSSYETHWCINKKTKSPSKIIVQLRSVMIELPLNHKTFELGIGVNTVFNMIQLSFSISAGTN